MSYSTDDDLEKIRPDIFKLGVSDFNNQRDEAEEIINRAIERDWYRNVAQDYGLDWRTTPFDADLLLHADTQLRRVSTYKTLEQIYLHIMKNAPNPDAFERQRSLFSKMYKEELNEVLNTGLDYDWSADSSIEAGENILPRTRRLFRV